MRVNDQHVTLNMLDSIRSPDKVVNCNFVIAVDFTVAKRLNSCCNKEEIGGATFEKLEGEYQGLETANIAWSWEK